ncbi:Longin-like domain-containing protein [Phakopsora pachyrhizi]|uniref:Coatomer subunit zeta n=1 Tax=Phakopsora pachyrhizi TaxID=170000 RepID=A0AAV0BLV8_PHAPC|nr:Longin-like domain-containing protein [Phakopsora pachyrhizi]CAH7688239.1 Longin-like domain-containing protein [Phakopsora pachyrhizi]
MSNLSIYTTTAVILLDSDGNRLISKYYEPPNLSQQQLPQNQSLNNNQLNFHGFSSQLNSLKEQRSFENTIWEKTRKSNGDILMIQNHLVLYKSIIDLTIYVIGQENENELMLQNLLNSFYDSLSILLRNQVEKRSVLENLDLVCLCLDEMVDDGIILETDSVAIASRVSRPKADVGGVNLSDITINEQTIMQAFSNLRDKAAQKILQGSL